MKKIQSKEDPIQNESNRVLYIDFSDTQGQLTPQSVVEFGQYWNSLKFQASKILCISSVSARIVIQAFMVVLVIYKNEEDPIKNEGAGVLTIFLLL